MADIISMAVVFIVLFVVFAILGFGGARFRKADLNQLFEWGLAGRRLGSILQFFLQGADWYTAYSILAVPSAVFALGAYGFFGVAYQAMVFTFAMVFVPKLWEWSRKNGYITGSDFIKDRFGSTALGIYTAAIGIAALIPYIALQIVGLQVILASMLVGTASAQLANEIGLIIAFIILAGFTYTSGLRSATLGAVLKDILVWLSLIAVVVVTLLRIGSFDVAFSSAPPNYVTLNPSLAAAFTTSMLGVVLSAYLWPHNVNSSFGAQSTRKLRIAFALSILYAIPLALADLLGVAVQKVPEAMNFLNQFPASTKGLFVIPSLLVNLTPSWFAGIALLGIFVGGLVPAAVMAIAQGNLIARNIAKEIKPNITQKGEADIAKWASAIFKFVALAFVFAIPATYDIQFYLVGAIIILQLFPALVIGAYSDWFKKEALFTGSAVGIIAGIYMVLVVNKFGPITSTLYPTPLGSMYIGILSLLLNLLITMVLSAIIPKRVKVAEKVPLAQKEDKN